MPYSADDITEMQVARDEWLEREVALTHALFRLRLENARAREMMTHGVCRRLSGLKHGLERVFEVLPPQEAEPTAAALHDATAFLQAFIINIFGVTDNLAWLWCHEADVRAANGRPMHRSRIGLRRDNADLRASLSVRTQSYLARTDAWFEYLEEYRHALAHRIPLYIPPKQLDEEAAAEAKRLEAQIGEPDWDWAQWPAVIAAQRRLGTFEPVMMHSFGEGARPIRLHGQMICDFATVIEVAEHVVADLHALRA